jgi:osmotically-inducible protein OsmY
MLMDGFACCGQSSSQVDVHLHRRLGPAVKNVTFDYDRGTLTLRGQVMSYYQKQLAQEAVIKLDHVREVVNRIEVSASSA